MITLRRPVLELKTSASRHGSSQSLHRRSIVSLEVDLNFPEHRPYLTARYPPPRRRRSAYAGVLIFPGTLQCLLYIITLLSVFGAAPVAATHGSIGRLEGVARLTEHGGILFDDRPPPVLHLQRRQSGGSPFDDSDDPSASSATSSATPSSILPPTTTATGQASTTSISIQTSSTSASGPLPSPFDTSLGSNFTSVNCPNFFDSFLSNSTFKACLPLSLLLQNSNSFFQASRSMTSITTTLDATCNVDLPTCNALMSSLANQLRADSNCGQDFRNQNPVVTQAYNGFLAYMPLYHAGCEKDAAGNYCYADAITNTSSVSDAYIYYLPLGIPLPGGARPTCSSCLQDTMAIFANYASNSTQPISTDYVTAAQQIDLSCGPSFINATIPVIKSSSSAPTSGGSTALLMVAVVASTMSLILL